MTPPALALPVQARETTPAEGIPAARPRKPQPQALPRVAEKDLVQAVARWLDGEPWPYDFAAFRPYHGINVRLRQCGDHLLEDGVPVLSRNPTVLRELPQGSHTTNRTEARALCAVAVRGDAWRYP